MSYSAIGAREEEWRLVRAYLHPHLNNPSFSRRFAITNSSSSSAAAAAGRKCGTTPSLVDKLASAGYGARRGRVDASTLTQRHIAMAYKRRHSTRRTQHVRTHLRTFEFAANLMLLVNWSLRRRFSSPKGIESMLSTAEVCSPTEIFSLTAILPPTEIQFLVEM